MTSGESQFYSDAESHLDAFLQEAPLVATFLDDHRFDDRVGATLVKANGGSGRCWPTGKGAPHFRALGLVARCAHRPHPDDPGCEGPPARLGSGRASARCPTRSSLTVSCCRDGCARGLSRSAERSPHWQKTGCSVDESLGYRVVTPGARGQCSVFPSLAARMTSGGKWTAKRQ